MTGPSTKRRSARKTTATAAGGRRSAGAAAADLEARIAWLEEQLTGAVRRPGMEYRAWFEQIVPPEASRHFMTAGREQLLGLRALVDHWIGRLDPESKPPTRETIRID